jgi:16S rRNA (guanine527-N7)-methyltransferase
VTDPGLSAHVQERLQHAGLTVSADALTRLTTYLGLLALWNRRTNLTAFQLDRPRDEAIDRLLVEPVVASQHVWRDDQTLLDLGSGGGSPGIPLALMCPWLSLTMVESRTKKASFLREAVRHLELVGASVEHSRFDQLRLEGGSDLVSFRAVRADAEFFRIVMDNLAPTGRVFWFGAPSEESSLPAPFKEVARVPLGQDERSWLVVAQRS